MNKEISKIPMKTNGRGQCEYCAKMKISETVRWYRSDCPYPGSNITMRECDAWKSKLNGIFLDEMLAEYDENIPWDDYISVVNCPICNDGIIFPPVHDCQVCGGCGKIQYSLSDVEIKLQ
jgi:hypothetical protein